MNKMVFKYLVFLILILGFVSCYNNDSNGKLVINSKSFKLCDSSLWVEKFKLTLYKKGSNFDSIVKVYITYRNKAEYYNFLRNHYFLEISSSDLDYDFILEIYSKSGQIYSFKFANIIFMEMGYGHDKHLIVASYMLNGKKYEMKDCDFNLCPLIVKQDLKGR